MVWMASIPGDEIAGLSSIVPGGTLKLFNLFICRQNMDKQLLIIAFWYHGFGAFILPGSKPSCIRHHPVRDDVTIVHSIKGYVKPGKQGENKFQKR
jgi:hypothetical protein